MAGSWDALSTGKMELSPGTRRRGLARRRGSGGAGTARSSSRSSDAPPGLAWTEGGELRGRRAAANTGLTLRAPTTRDDPPSQDGPAQGFAAQGLPHSAAHHSRRALYPHRDRISPPERSRECLAPVQPIVTQEGQAATGQPGGQPAGGRAGGDGAGGSRTHPGSSISLRGQRAASPMPSSGRGGRRSAGACPALHGTGRDGQVPRKEKHVGNVFCLWFHLGAFNLLAQLIGTINLQPQLTTCTGLKMVIKAFPAWSASLVAGLVLAWAVSAEPAPALWRCHRLPLHAVLTAPSPWHVGPTPRGSQTDGKGLEPAGGLGYLCPSWHCHPHRAIN